jgi:hypothetical protein
MVLVFPDQLRLLPASSAAAASAGPRERKREDRKDIVSERKTHQSTYTVKTWTLEGRSSVTQKIVFRKP